MRPDKLIQALWRLCHRPSIIGIPGAPVSHLADLRHLQCTLICDSYMNQDVRSRPMYGNVTTATARKLLYMSV